MTIEERLNRLLNQSEKENAELRLEIDRLKRMQNACLLSCDYTHDKMANMFKRPFIELRYLGLPDWGIHTDGFVMRTGLVYNRSDQHIVCFPLSHTWRGDKSLPDIADFTDVMPAREYSHILVLIEQLDLPVYVKVNHYIRKIHCDDGSLCYACNEDGFVTEYIVSQGDC